MDTLYRLNEINGIICQIYDNRFSIVWQNILLKINFNGGDLSSDAGLLLIKEFSYKLGFVKLLKSEFKTNDRASFRFHKDDENLWQISTRFSALILKMTAPMNLQMIQY